MFQVPTKLQLNQREIFSHTSAEDNPVQIRRLSGTESINDSITKVIELTTLQHALFYKTRIIFFKSIDSNRD